MTLRAQNHRLSQRGAATLVIVMMLFLVMALLAAYANRSLLFEQRMSVSYARANLSQEAAEGGIEWTLAQLNGTAIDATCKPVAEGGQRFADRYLQIDAPNRIIQPKTANGVVDCSRDSRNRGWACRCPPATDARTPSPAVDAQPPSSFVVRMTNGVSSNLLPPGLVRLNIIGCTDSVVDNCMGNAGDTSKALVGKASASTLIGLVSAVRSPPAMPLVVRGNIDSSGAGRLGLHNTDPRAGGLLATVGGDWHGMLNERLDSVPGSPADQAVAQRDRPIGDLDADHVFKKFMGTSVSRYAQHPSLRTITCDGDCSGAIEDAYKAGQRILWVNGPMEISSSKVFGSIGDPLLVIATGDVTLAGSFQFTGMLVAQSNVTWTNTAGAVPLITGMMLVGGDMRTVGSMDISYQQGVADQLRNRMGSYVRVPGSWIDTSQGL